MELFAATTAQNTVAIAAIGLAATCVAGIVWLTKYLAQELSRDLKAHTEAAVTQTKSNEKIAAVAEAQAESNREMLVFMKSLNGKLVGAVVHTAGEVSKSKKKEQE